MVDGTGMCGACRVTVGGKTKFVCVDGPEFDAHAVDFDEMLARLRQYTTAEKIAYLGSKLLKKSGGNCKHGRKSNVSAGQVQGLWALRQRLSQEDRRDRSGDHQP